MPVRTVTDACPGVFAPHDAADGALARVRLPGGAITADALRVVADCADELGDGRVHLTSRGNLQMRGLSRTPALAERLAAAGLLPSPTHERVRNVLASPLSGIARGAGAGDPPFGTSTVGPTPSDPPFGTSTVGPTPGDPPFGTSTVAAATLDVPSGGSCDVRGTAAALDRGLCARPGLATLPGRFLFALDDGRGDVAAEDPDLCWRAVTARPGGPASGVLLVAGVAVAAVPIGDAVRALLDAAEAFLALREADGGTAWRVAEVADAPARIAAALDAGGQHPGRQGGTADVGCTRGHPAGPRRAAQPGPVVRDDGGLALVVAPVLGELTAAQIRLLADASPTAVVTPWRTVVLPGPRVPAAHLAVAGLVVAPGPAADLSACAGRPGCAKALADVRADARAALAETSGGRFPAGRVHVSGCARRCGAPRSAHLDAVALEGGGYLVDGVPRPGLVP